MWSGVICSLAVSALTLQGAEPFAVKLADLSGTWFESGAVIHVPPAKCATLQVRLATPWSREIGVDQLTLSWDGTYPHPARGTSVEGHILTMTTREPLGLLTGAEHHLETTAIGRTPLRSEWTILRWEKSYIEATAVHGQGVPVEVRLDQPPGGVILAEAGSVVRFTGEISGTLDAKLSIAGQTVRPLPNRPGFHFDQPLEVAAGTKEIVIVATDVGETSTTLVLPLLSRGGR